MQRLQHLYEHVVKNGLIGDATHEPQTPARKPRKCIDVRLIEPRFALWGCETAVRVEHGKHWARQRGGIVARPSVEMSY